MEILVLSTFDCLFQYFLDLTISDVLVRLWLIDIDVDFYTAEE